MTKAKKQATFAERLDAARKEQTNDEQKRKLEVAKDAAEKEREAFNQLRVTIKELFDVDVAEVVWTTPHGIGGYRRPLAKFDDVLLAATPDKAYIAKQCTYCAEWIYFDSPINSEWGDPYRRLLEALNPDPRRQKEWKGIYALGGSSSYGHMDVHKCPNKGWHLVDERSGAIRVLKPQAEEEALKGALALLGYRLVPGKVTE